MAYCSIAVSACCEQVHHLSSCAWYLVGHIASPLIQVKDPKNPTKQKEDRELIKFTGPADSVYLKARDYVELDVGTGEYKSACCRLQPKTAVMVVVVCHRCSSVDQQQWLGRCSCGKLLAVQPCHGIISFQLLHLAFKVVHVVLEHSLNNR